MTGLEVISEPSDEEYFLRYAVGSTNPRRAVLAEDIAKLLALYELPDDALRTLAECGERDAQRVLDWRVPF